MAFSKKIDFSCSEDVLVWKPEYPLSSYLRKSKYTVEAFPHCFTFASLT